MLLSDSIFGIHEQALLLGGKRASLIANNIANADTPGYLAKDLDFKNMLRAQIVSEDGLSMADDSKNTSRVNFQSMDSLKYRIPNQVSADGNTVDINLEKSEFANNTMRWLASYTFINQSVKEIRSALRGGQ